MSIVIIFGGFKSVVIVSLNVISLALQPITFNFLSFVIFNVCVSNFNGFHLSPSKYNKSLLCDSYFDGNISLPSINANCLVGTVYLIITCFELYVSSFPLISFLYSILSSPNNNNPSFVVNICVVSFLYKYIFKFSSIIDPLCSSILNISPSETVVEYVL